MTDLNKFNFHFWQPFPNAHESGWIKGLSRRGLSVFVYANEQIPKWRSAMGLGTIDYGNAEIIYTSPEILESHLKSCTSSTDIHFFTGIKEFDLNRRAYDHIKSTQAPIFYISESKDIRGIKGILRFCRDMVYDSQVRKRVDAMLPMGQLGVNWFRRIGFDEERMFEYGYSISNAPSVQLKRARTGTPFRIAYVGQLIKRKRVETIINAITKLTTETSDFELLIIGTGEEESHIKKATDELEVSRHITFLGPVKNEKIREILADCDLLVLPSAWDGWGAVTNEALLSGCRVGVSDMCGSSVLCKCFSQCFTFSSGDASALHSELATQIMMGKVTNAERSQRITKAEQVIGENAITEYLLRIVDFTLSRTSSKPLPPWIEQHSPSISETSHHRRTLAMHLPDTSDKNAI